MRPVTRDDIDRTELDTRDHIRKVQDRMAEAIEILKYRSIKHDQSKLREPELSGYAALQKNLADAVYGTEEYRERLAECRPTIEHHYANNDHHPEYHAAGIVGMSLLALIEMLADWKAAGERTKDGSMYKSLWVNRRRFAANRDVHRILTNTAYELGWIDAGQWLELVTSPDEVMR